MICRLTKASSTSEPWVLLRSIVIGGGAPGHSHGGTPGGHGGFGSWITSVSVAPLQLFCTDCSACEQTPAEHEVKPLSPKLNGGASLRCHRLKNTPTLLGTAL